jgi:hypothetical protein
MPFPLPLDPFFRKEIVWMWIHDISDRLKLGDTEGAEISWKTANEIYLSLAPGEGSPEIEKWMFSERVKLDNITHKTNENTL